MRNKWTINEAALEDRALSSYVMGYVSSDGHVLFRRNGRLNNIGWYSKEKEQVDRIALS